MSVVHHIERMSNFESQKARHIHGSEKRRAHYVLTTFSFRAKCYAFYGSTNTLLFHGRTAVTNMFAWKIQNGRFRKPIGKGLSQSVWSIVCLLPILFIHGTEDDKVRRKLRLSHQFCSCCWGRAVDDVIIGKQVICLLALWAINDFFFWCPKTAVQLWLQITVIISSAKSELPTANIFVGGKLNKSNVNGLCWQTHVACSVLR